MLFDVLAGLLGLEVMSPFHRDGERKGQTMADQTKMSGLRFANVKAP
jgi:hypothetical protein